MNSKNNFDDSEVFGKFLIANIRDAILDEVEAFISGKSMILNSYKLTQKLSEFEIEDVKVVREVVAKSVDNALSNLLYKLQYEQEQESQVKIIVGQTEVSQMSDFLQGELHSDEGWVERFSQYKSS
jgi:hypothetical protein